MNIELAPLELSPQNSLRRDAPRLEHLRDQSYEERFDALTVFYDCFRTVDDSGTLLLGPPLLNLKPTVLHALRRAYGMFWLLQMRVRKLDRHSQICMGPTSDLDLPPDLFQQNRLVTNPNHCNIFRQRRVVLTLSRDNELQWIKDWTHFFVRKHGADAVLLYDNASTKYESDEIREVINSVPGLAVGVVVDWPFRYGIQDHSYPEWSDFCQYGVLEHARHRFLAGARAVVNADIDEFPITKRGESLFDIALRSGTGYLKYGGQWVENASLSPEAELAARRHKHYSYSLRSPLYDHTRNIWTHKWTVIPARCAPDAQWCVHLITQMTPDPLSSLVRFRHFKAINTNWAFDRWRPESLNKRDHVVDEELREWLRVFDG